MRAAVARTSWQRNSLHRAALGVPVRAEQRGLWLPVGWGPVGRHPGLWVGWARCHPQGSGSLGELFVPTRVPDAGLAWPPRGVCAVSTECVGRVQLPPAEPRGRPSTASSCTGVGRARPAHVSLPPRACTREGPAAGSSRSPRVGGSATLGAGCELVQGGSHVAQAGWCGVWTISNHSCLAQPSGLKGTSYWTSAHVGRAPRLSGRLCSRQSPGGLFCQG